MALGSASVVAPVMIGSKSSEWQGYAKRVFLVSVAAVAIICIGVIIAERKSSNQSDALGGAYYAVTKPPAFNFNRKSPQIISPLMVSNNALWLNSPFLKLCPQRAPHDIE
jgi:hypothetical protein